MIENLYFLLSVGISIIFLCLSIILYLKLSRRKLELSFLKAQIEQERFIFNERLNDQHILKNELEELSAKAVLEGNDRFLNLAKHTLEGQMLSPIKKALEQVDEKLHNLEKERLSAYVDLKRQVQDLINSQNVLRMETSNLVKALRNPNARGQWGEIQLRRVIEMAGMLNHCDFQEQMTLSEGKLRPDVVVRLPGEKFIVIDAKTPLEAYLKAHELEDENRNVLLEQHARHLRSHIKILSQRAYFEQFECSPEFVIMFLPGESFFSAALEKDPSLIEYGVQEKVILATPTTLIALLKSISYGWRQEAIAGNVKIMGQLGKELYKRLYDLSAHLSKLGRQIGQVVEGFNAVAGSYERRVLVCAKKMSDLDTVDKDLVIETPNLLDSYPRPIQSDVNIEIATSSNDKLP